ncbi:hypothetical protein V9T40_011804 [Parthenolecanium corni]|uniref:Uncharacterized protein n=1 Tax=Parthenolecanium corni TaxID=536013 RepID=A0AAN9T643_9HEMI
MEPRFSPPLWKSDGYIGTKLNALSPREISFATQCSQQALQHSAPATAVEKVETRNQKIWATPQQRYEPEDDHHRTADD